MSNEPNNSLLSSAWHGAVVLCGIAVLLWVAAQLISQVWVWLLIIGGAAVVVTATIVVLRWWLQKRRW